MAVYKKTSGRKGYYFKFMLNGVQHKKEKNPFNNEPMTTKTECAIIENKYREYLKIENKGSSLTLNELFEEYLTNTKGFLKVATKRKYDLFQRQYLTLLENKDIKEYNVNDITKWLNKITKIDANENYINRIIAMMKSLLQYGSDVYNLSGNLRIPLLNTYKTNKIPEEKPKLKKWISEKQFNSMLELLDKTAKREYYYYTVLLVLYNSGLRIGELAALTIEDYKDKALNVNKNYIRINGVDYIQTPKTKNSIRKVQLSDEVCKTLDYYIEWFKPSDVLFSLESKYLTQQKVGIMLKKLAKELNYNDLELHAHTLRHSHASNLRAKGWNEYQIANRLGNTAQVSSSTYIHFETPDINDF